MLPYFLDTYSISAIFEQAKKMNFLSFALSIFYYKLYKKGCPRHAQKKNCIELPDFEDEILPKLDPFQ